MERYDYRKAMAEAVEGWMADDMFYRGFEDFGEWARFKAETAEGEEIDWDAVYQACYDEMFVDDGVTGNASGSYTFSEWEAEEYLCHNYDLLREACEEFCCEVRDLPFEAEAADVTIRCYLLGEATANELARRREVVGI